MALPIAAREMLRGNLAPWQFLIEELLCLQSSDDAGGGYSEIARKGSRAMRDHLRPNSKVLQSQSGDRGGSEGGATPARLIEVPRIAREGHLDINRIRYLAAVRAGDGAE